MSSDREYLAALVRTVERLAVDGHERLRELAADARVHLDSTPESCTAAVEAAGRAAYAAGQAAGTGARPDRRQGAP